MTDIKSSFHLTGLHCSSCEKLISKRLSKINDVRNVVVDSTSGQTEITATRPIQVNEVKTALADTEYKIIT